MPDPTPPLDLAAIAARHQAYPSPVGQLCDDDEQEWPCDAAALVARVRALEAEGCPYCTLIGELEAKVAALEAEVAQLRGMGEHT
jgi:hypothetical protein